MDIIYFTCHANRVFFLQEAFNGFFISLHLSVYVVVSHGLGLN